MARRESGRHRSALALRRRNRRRSPARGRGGCRARACRRLSRGGRDAQNPRPRAQPRCCAAPPICSMRAPKRSRKRSSPKSASRSKKARGESARLGEMLRLAAFEGAQTRGETLPLDALANPPGEGKIGFTLVEPCGVVVAITPFNYPQLLVMHKIAPALAVGNAVILKPASQTPLSALRIVEIMLEAGIPPRRAAMPDRRRRRNRRFALRRSARAQNQFHRRLRSRRANHARCRSQKTLARIGIELALHCFGRRRFGACGAVERGRRLCQRRSSLHIDAARVGR